MSNVPLAPEQASTIAPKIDLVLYVLTGLSAFFLFAVCAILVFLAIRYRKGTKVNRVIENPDAKALELTWTIIPTIMGIAVFVWTALVYFEYSRPPENAMEILVTGKQWMWKIQHPNGKREINQLHVPLGVPVKLTMTSEDVIHSFFVPVFRVKRDVLPNRYSDLWFEATKTGTFHLFCAEYCGTDHSRMVGQVVVMEPEEYELWLSGANVGVPAASAGEKLFTKLGCVTCHEGTSPRGPALKGVFGKEVQLQTGEMIVVDEDYIRESILNPQAKLVAGYPPLMPTFQNQIREQDLFTLINYIKSMSDEQNAKSGTTS
ncbi:MAG: cytochrome c oxidase subunit II [Candidatus Hydrogenedentes bacterium]|nr:cytochrome c oxidase subunit II [Candidatus Hydrogenedentota bacterium]